MTASQKSKQPVVAIDGPAGAGKTTVTRRVAAELGYTLVDTGALYRCVALSALEASLDLEDTEAVGSHAQELADTRAISFRPTADGAGAVLLRGRDVSSAIRTPDLSQAASVVSAVPAVRDALLSLQREAGNCGAVVLEGRDIGTVVFPQAQAKFFLTAGVDVRARRRMEELKNKGVDLAFEDVRREVQERDRRDSERPIAPLKRADDAVLVDSSNMGIEQVVESIVAQVRSIESKLDASQS